MTYLEQVRKPRPQAPIITLVGFPGVGKSTLGGLFPSPIFIQAENAGAVFEKWPEEKKPPMFPIIPSASAARGIMPSETIIEQLRELISQPHGFKTVVIDAVTTLHALFEDEIVSFDPNKPSNIGDAAGSYGKGYLAAANLHAKVMNACEHLRRRGIGVVFLAHTGIGKIKNRPDVEAYSTWTIDMHEASRRIYVANSDAVIYMHSREFVTGVETDKKGRLTKLGKIRSTGERILITSSEGTTGFVDAKNRYGMPCEIECEEGDNPILQYVPFYNTTETEGHE